jgi:tetratricopeptide (TPR) repeat protein
MQIKGLSYPASFDFRDGSLFTCIGIVHQADEMLVSELVRAGRLGDAEDLVVERAEDWKRLEVPAHHPIHAHVGVLRGRVLREQKNYAGAQDALKNAFEQLKDNLLTPTVRRDQALQELVALYDAWNKPDEAQRYRAMLSTATPDERELAELNARLDQAFTAYSERRRPQAEDLYQQALPIWNAGRIIRVRRGPGT